MHPRLAQLRFAARVAPRLLDRRQRLLWQEMRRFCRALPVALEGPLPEALTKLSVKPPDDPLPQWANEKMVRQLADLAILVEHETGLGICLRRSLTRYHYLHRLGLPLVVTSVRVWMDRAGSATSAATPGLPCTARLITNPPRTTAALPSCTPGLSP